MSVVLLVARLVVAGVFGVAGLAKLRDPAGTRQAATDFGVSAALASPIARLLPWAEIVLALLLLPIATARIAATAAAALLAVFAIAIAVNVSRGKRTVCHCFGQVGTEPVGWGSVGRNVALAAAAVFVAWPTPASPGAGLFAWWYDAPSAARPALALATIACVGCVSMAFAFLGLMRQHGKLLLRLDALERAATTGAHASPPPPRAATASAPAESGLRPGTVLPAFSLKDLDERRVSAASFVDGGRPVLLVFSDPQCGPCTTMQPDLEHWARTYADRFSLVVVTRGDKQENRRKYAGTAAAHVLLDADTKVARRLGTLPTPSALVVDAKGRVASDVAMGPQGIEAMVASLIGTVPPRVSAADPTTPALPTVGAGLPPFDLPSASGGRLTHDALRGRQTLLVFWNTGCGFCQRMLDPLRHWEATREPGAPALFLISAGSAADNRAQGLAAPIALDDTFAYGRALGAPGTPSAVLVDSDLRLASRVAVGEPAIWSLLGVESPDSVLITR